MSVRVESELPASHEAFDVSDAAAMTALHRAEAEHFWHRARNRLIERRLRALGVRPPARLIDLGCGAGTVAAALARAGYQVTGVDGHASLLALAARRAPAATWIAHDLRRGVAELPRHDHHAALLLDVIEHLDDPVQALTDAVACVEPGGLVVGTVPALRALWSVVDERAGHRRRYHADDLRRELAAVPGARVLEVRWFFRALVPLLLAQRRWVSRRRGNAVSDANLAVPPWPVNLALAALTEAEARLEPWVEPLGLPGASLWFALRRDPLVAAPASS